MYMRFGSFLSIDYLTYFDNVSMRDFMRIGSSMISIIYIFIRIPIFIIVPNSNYLALIICLFNC